MIATMQDAIGALPPRNAEAAPSVHAIVVRLQRSEIFRDYQQAFETTTGLPLALRALGSFQPPLHGSKRANPFCILMATKNKSCAACLQLQQRIEESAGTETKTLECFAGLNESTVPIRIGEIVIGHLQTGQVLLREPSKARFKSTIRQLSEWETTIDARQLEAAYFRTRVLAKRQYEAVLRLLVIFAQQLSALCSQLMVQEAAGDPPVVVKARSFIAEHLDEELTLSRVAHAVSLSPFYFCKTFKRATGLTLTEYLARGRVEKTKYLLLNPHMRISEAAFAVGFQSLSQFNRVFRRIVREVPSSYRDRLHGLKRNSTCNPLFVDAA
jgi:AraC-like DNA-binding protein/ligand-binding sensor protein